MSPNTIVLTRLLSNTCCPTAMGEEIQEWQHLWGAKVKMPIDVPDDILKAGITTVISKLDEYPDFENDGLKISEEVKKQFDEEWGGKWHCVIGRSFGSFVTHETQRFMYFYIGDKAVMLYKAG